MRTWNKIGFLALCLSFLGSSVTAQKPSPFLGSINIERTIYDTETGEAEGVTPLRIDINTNRMRLTSGGTITVSRSLASIQTNMIFLRNDKDDILFVTSPTEAVQLTRQGLVQIMTMMKQFSSLTGSTSPETKVKRTTETKTVQGLKCAKVIVSRSDRDEETHVWVTEDLNIDWGIVNDIPDDLGLNFSGLIDPAWLKSGSFPMEAVTYRDGKVRAEAKVVEVMKNDPLSRNLDVGPEVKTVAITDYIFKSIWR